MEAPKVKLEYTTAVDANSSEDPMLFDAMVSPLVSHPLGWCQYGYTFQNVAHPSGAHPYFKIILTPDSVMRTKFPSFAEDQLSVCDMDAHVIYLNEMRWRRQIPDKSQLSLPEYRAYLVSHEVGHILGKRHAKCGGKGQEAPTMMQQTRGIGGCTPSPWPNPRDASMAKRY